jgi:hypothetical protein
VDSFDVAEFIDAHGNRLLRSAYGEGWPARRQPGRPGRSRSQIRLNHSGLVPTTRNTGCITLYLTHF